MPNSDSDEDIKVEEPLPSHLVRFSDLSVPLFKKVVRCNLYIYNNKNIHRKYYSLIKINIEADVIIKENP